MHTLYIYIKENIYYALYHIMFLHVNKITKLTIVISKIGILAINFCNKIYLILKPLVKNFYFFSFFHSGDIKIANSLLIHKNSHEIRI